MLMVECIWLDNSINNLIRKYINIKKEFMSDDVKGKNKKNSCRSFRY